MHLIYLKRIYSESIRPDLFKPSPQKFGGCLHIHTLQLAMGEATQRG